MKMNRSHARKDRGFVLVGTYFFLAVLMVYSGSVTMQATTQHRAVDRLLGRHQALDLAMGATEQLRDDLYLFLSTQIYQIAYKGNAVQALQWLDQLGAGGGPLLTANPFDLSLLGNRGQAPNSGNGTSEADPRIVSLLSMGAGSEGRAWVVSVTNPGGTSLSPRSVVLEATASEGGTVKRIRTTLTVGLGLSDIFRYAYFMNNYGWFSNMAGSINGEVRANGNLRFTNSPLLVNGDLYASANPDLVDPQNPGAGPAKGEIFGNPPQSSGFSGYWDYKKTAPKGQGDRARPAKRLVLKSPSVPAIGGTPAFLPDGGYGWDSDDPEQARYPYQEIQPMPYLGDLTLYKELATDYVNPQTGNPGSTLTSPGGVSGGVTYPQITVNAVYTGPDGSPDTPDDKTTVVLIGTTSNPIVLNGPVVIPGDVIIRGVITGQGTIYAGRNIHLVGSLTYKNPPSWPVIERNSSDGRLQAVSGGTTTYLGKVDNNGTYTYP